MLIPVDVSSTVTLGKECAAFDAGGPEEDMINTAASAD
jgi:hypothetical protein